MKSPRPGNNGLSLKGKKTLNLESMTAGGYTPVDSNDKIGGRVWRSAVCPSGVGGSEMARLGGELNIEFIIIDE